MLSQNICIYKKSVAVLNRFYKRVCKIPAHSDVTYKENPITFAIVYIYIHIVYRYNIDIIFQHMSMFSYILYTISILQYHCPKTPKTPDKTPELTPEISPDKTPEETP